MIACTSITARDTCNAEPYCVGSGVVTAMMAEYVRANNVNIYRKELNLQNKINIKTLENKHFIYAFFE